MDEYARFASLYDGLIGSFLRPMHMSMLAACTARQCHKILDLCCGTGLFAGMAADAGHPVVGVDLSSAMLSVARAKHPTVTFIDGDATSLIFPDNDFDAVTISFALHEKPAKIGLAILAEAQRVTRPGGLILVGDYRRPVPLQARWTGWAIALVERLAGKEHFAHFQNFMHGGGSESFLPRAGLMGLPAMTFMHGWAGFYINMGE